MNATRAANATAAPHAPHTVAPAFVPASDVSIAGTDVLIGFLVLFGAVTLCICAFGAVRYVVFIRAQRKQATEAQSAQGAGGAV